MQDLKRTHQLTTILLKYWKQIAAVLAIIGLLFVIHHSGYVAGKKEIQTAWDAQKLVDAQAAAKAAAKTASIVVNSETETQHVNDVFKNEVDRYKGFYNLSNSVPTTGVRKPAVRKANSSAVPQLSGNSGQFETTSADTVSRADYQKLADDCLATTIQLNNAQEWAAEQAKIYNTEGR